MVSETDLDRLVAELKLVRRRGIGRVDIESRSLKRVELPFLRALTGTDGTSSGAFLAKLEQLILDAIQQLTDDSHIHIGLVLYGLVDGLREDDPAKHEVRPDVLRKIALDWYRAKRNPKADLEYFRKEFEPELIGRISAIILSNLATPPRESIPPAVEVDSLLPPPVELEEKINILRLRLYEQIDDAIHRRSNVVMITGETGSGKSVLAKTYAQVNEPDPRRVIYLDFRDSSLRSFRLGDETLRLGLGLDHLPDDEQYAGIAEILATDDGRLKYAILDNVTSWAQVRPLIPAAPEVPILITANAILEPDRMISRILVLDLSHAEVEAMVNHYLEDVAEQELAIFKRIFRSPILLQQSCAYLADKDVGFRSVFLATVQSRVSVEEKSVDVVFYEELVDALGKDVKTVHALRLLEIITAQGLLSEEHNTVSPGMLGSILGVSSSTDRTSIYQSASAILYNLNLIYYTSFPDTGYYLHDFTRKKLEVIFRPSFKMLASRLITDQVSGLLSAVTYDRMKDRSGVFEDRFFVEKAAVSLRHQLLRAVRFLSTDYEYPRIVEESFASSGEQSP